MREFLVKTDKGRSFMVYAANFKEGVNLAFDWAEQEGVEVQSVETKEN